MILLDMYFVLIILTIFITCEGKPIPKGRIRKNYGRKVDDIFCKNSINPPRRIDIYENNDQFLVAWERPSGSKACDVTYQVTINVDSAAVVNEQTKAENFVLSHNFEEDYCSVIEINVQAMSNQMKSAVTREEFMIGSKDNCDQAIDTRESEDVDLAQRMAVDPVEENANELMKRMFVALDERNGLLEYS